MTKSVMDKDAGDPRLALIDKYNWLDIGPEPRALMGEAFLLASEDHRIYEDMLRRLYHTIDPVDFVEMLWIKEYADLVWEIQRYRRAMRDSVARETVDEDAIGRDSFLLKNVEKLAPVHRLIDELQRRGERILREIDRRRLSAAVAKRLDVLAEGERRRLLR